MSIAQDHNDSFLIARPIDGGIMVVGLKQSQLEALSNQIHLMGHGKEELAREVAQFIDKCPQYKMAGGFGHRIFYGHSVTDAAKVYEKYGFSGLTEWSKHLGKDFTSPDGLPLPFAKEIAKELGLNVKEASEWLTVNLADVFAASLAGAGIIHDFVSDAPPLSKLARGIIVGSVGIATDNPLLVIEGGAAIVASVIGLIMGEDGTIDLNMEHFSNLEGPINIDFQCFQTEFENFSNF